MPAILVEVGTKYACNPSYDRDHICLQFRKFSKYLESDRLGSKRDLKKFEIAGINGPHQIRLQAYLVPNVIKIAGIFGPYHDQSCRHIWSPM